MILKCPHMLEHLSLGRVYHWLELIRMYGDTYPHQRVEYIAHLDSDIQKAVTACVIGGMHQEMSWQSKDSNRRVVNSLMYLVKPTDAFDFLLKLERSVRYDADNISIDEFSWNRYYRAYVKYSSDFIGILELMVDHYSSAVRPCIENINSLYLQLLPLRLGKHMHRLLGSKINGYHTMPLREMMDTVHTVLKSYSDASDALHSVTSYMQKQHQAKAPVASQKSSSTDAVKAKVPVASQKSSSIDAVKVCFNADTLSECKQSSMCPYVHDAEQRARHREGFLERERQRLVKEGTLDESEAEATM